MKSKTIATNEDWTGIEFANDWIIEKKLSCAEYRQIYIEQTGDTTKQIKNAHYLCYNKNCNIRTYIERTVIQRAINSNRNYLSKCKGCKGVREDCHYSIQCRVKTLNKVPDRTSKINIGDIFGNWQVISIFSSGNSIGHEKSAKCSCLNCGNTKLIRFSHILDYSAVCDCFKSRSSGEMAIKRILDELKIKYQSEYIFDNLVGLKGGSLRYDFAILNNDKTIKCLIEFDGKQHYEIGSYFNQTGKVQIHDDIKNKFAKERNIPLLRIPYYEINNIDEIITTFLSNI